MPWLRPSRSGTARTSTARAYSRYGLEQPAAAAARGGGRGCAGGADVVPELRALLGSTTAAASMQLSLLRAMHMAMHVMMFTVL